MRGSSTRTIQKRICNVCKNIRIRSHGKCGLVNIAGFPCEGHMKIYSENRNIKKLGEF